MSGNPSTDAIWTDLSLHLRRFVRRRVSDDHVAEDLLQEIFLRIHRHLDALTSAESLAPWVYQIARNVVHDHHRKAGDQAAPLVDLEPAEELDSHTDRKRCQGGAWQTELIQRLPDNYREAVRMSEVEGLTQQEVADRLGLSLSGAKSRVQRGRAMLKELFEQCCTFHFDRRGNLMDVDPNPNRTVCRNCDDDPTSGCH